MADKKEEQEYYEYGIWLNNNAPIRLISPVDLVTQYREQLAELAKKGEWWRPIVFKDERGEVVGAFSVYAIQGVMRALVVPQQTPAPVPAGVPSVPR